MVMHTCNPSSWEVEAGVSEVRGYPWQNRENSRVSGLQETISKQGVGIRDGGMGDVKIKKETGRRWERRDRGRQKQIGKSLLFIVT